MQLWGGSGGNAKGVVDDVTVTANGGKGGHVKAYRKCKKDTYLYMYNGGKGGDTTTSSSGGSNGGANGGASGYTYSTSSGNKYYGAGGGGATFVADVTTSLVSNLE